ncbi:MAG: HupE/UreJ family protein [Bryobacterales bacterium]|nr:HupE/UreJ family protein [Bryobacterales bacterium]MBV9396551.1 HupE/UreJ family protein [Bryobacterales bacterium]
MPRWCYFVIAAFVSLGCAFAHDIPNDVTVQAFLKPEGNRVHLLVRVPMKAMRDVEFPERPPGFLDFDRLDRVLQDAATLWVSDWIQLYENDALLPKPQVIATRASLESDKSFLSYDQAAAHLTGPKLTNATTVVWNQIFLDVWFDYPIHSDQSNFSIHPALDRLGVRVVTVLRFLPLAPNGAERPIRAFDFSGDPGLVRLDPRWYQAAARFVQGGFFHILSGTDHLLFLFALVIPYRKFRALIPIVTAFTVAHSITLIASAYDLAPSVLWFPPLIETLIAASIVYMALENITGTSTVHRRWIIAFGFGLVHGFGFSFALRETLQFAGSHLLTSLLSFNVGVELGQLLVLLVLIPVIDLLFRYTVAERMGTIILSAFVAHTGWHWMLDRGDKLIQYRFEWPEFNATFVVSLLHWLMAIIALAGLVWFVSAVLRGRDASADGWVERADRE